MKNWLLENTYTTLPNELFSHQLPVSVEKPELVIFNEGLAQNLGLKDYNWNNETMVKYFSGNAIPEGTTPIAQAYAGHQFGHFTMLGDGRAVLLGEHITPKGESFDIQLKGSGKTPYSRRGDGRATLYSMLREYMISESMHYLNIPTTRSLAVIGTGEKVYRENIEDGGILTRIAASHIRVGTFEYVRNFSSLEDLKALVNYTLERHYPAQQNSDNPALSLLNATMLRQIDLIVHWMRVGFIHGVMNTDNMSIAGETIDYGPCAFMNFYSPSTVFSSIDRQGRYAFGNQPHITQWNLTAFANALLPAISESPKDAVKLAQEVIDEFQRVFTDKWYEMMLNKLGIQNQKREDRKLVDSLLSLMEKTKADYTQTFSALAQDKDLGNELFKSEEFGHWKKNWETTIESGNRGESLKMMNSMNPKIIPRNHWVEDVLKRAVQGNIEPLNALLKNLSTPYRDQPNELQFEQVPTNFDASYQTYCGT